MASFRMSAPVDVKPRAIAFFSPRLVSGGTQRHIIEVIRLMDRSRFLPLVVSVKSGGPLAPTVRAAGVDLFELGLGSSMASRELLRCVREAIEILRAHRVAIVQYFEWRGGLIALLAARAVGGCRVVAARRSVPKERGLQRLVAEIVVRAADRIIVNAELLRPKGRVGQRADVVPSGVDTDRFCPKGRNDEVRRNLGIPEDAYVIGTVGRLEARKQTSMLLSAVAAIRAAIRSRVCLLVVGDGPLRRDLERDAERLGIRSAVRFLGDRLDVHVVLAALDAFVLPSRTEGMSNALLEAMATGLPVVATAVGGTPEVISDGKSGLLVSATDPHQLAVALETLCENEELSTQLGEAARRVVEERFGARAMVRRLEALYSAVAPEVSAEWNRPVAAGRGDYGLADRDDCQG